MAEFIHPNELVNLLRQIRKDAGVTQEGLASVAGFSLNQIYNWENAIASPTLDNAIRWAAALGYEFDLMLIYEKELTK